MEELRRRIEERCAEIREKMRQHRAMATAAKDNGDEWFADNETIRRDYHSRLQELGYVLTFFAEDQADDGEGLGMRSGSSAAAGGGGGAGDGRG